MLDRCNSISHLIHLILFFLSSKTSKNSRGMYVCMHVHDGTAVFVDCISLCPVRLLHTVVRALNYRSPLIILPSFSLGN